MKPYSRHRPELYLDATEWGATAWTVFLGVTAITQVIIQPQTIYSTFAEIRLHKGSPQYFRPVWCAQALS